MTTTEENKRIPDEYQETVDEFVKNAERNGSTLQCEFIKAVKMWVEHNKRATVWIPNHQEVYSMVNFLRRLVDVDTEDRNCRSCGHSPTSHVAKMKQNKTKIILRNFHMKCNDWNVKNVSVLNSNEIITYRSFKE